MRRCIQDRGVAGTITSVPHAHPRRDDAISGGVAAPIAHDSAARHVSGEAVYVDDMPELPGTLHVYVAMSERAACAHRRARRLRGAHSAGRRLRADGRRHSRRERCEPGLPRRSGLRRGRGRNMPASRSSRSRRRRIEAARAAAKLRAGRIRGPAGADHGRRCARGRRRPACRRTRCGSATSMPRSPRAPRRISGTLHVGGQDHFYLEGQVAYAIPGEGGDMLVHSSTQHPSRGAAQRRQGARPCPTTP